MTGFCGGDNDEDELDPDARDCMYSWNELQACLGECVEACARICERLSVPVHGNDFPDQLERTRNQVRAACADAIRASLSSRSAPLTVAQPTWTTPWVRFYVRPLRRAHRDGAVHTRGRQVSRLLHWLYWWLDRHAPCVWCKDLGRECFKCSEHTKGVAQAGGKREP